MKTVMPYILLFFLASTFTFMNAQEEALPVHKTSSKMKIDGKSNESSWQKAEAYSFEFFYRAEKSTDKQYTTLKMLWDEEHLYFFFECDDQFITARETERDGQPYFDDCAEIFLIPNSTKINMHLGYELNLYKASNDFVYINDILGDEDYVIRSFNPEFEIALEVNGTVNDNSDEDQGWTMEMAIPVANFHINGPTSPVEPGMKWAFLAVRQDRNDATGNRRSTSTIFPLSPEKPDVHDPKSFGLMEFVNR